MTADKPKHTPGEWRDIATAPKDGTRILGYYPGDDDPELFQSPMISVCYWMTYPPHVHWELVDADKELWHRSISTPAYFNSDHDALVNPTHWMPLPDPLKAEGQS